MLLILHWCHAAKARPISELGHRKVRPIRNKTYGQMRASPAERPSFILGAEQAPGQLLSMLATLQNDQRQGKRCTARLDADHRRVTRPVLELESNGCSGPKSCPTGPGRTGDERGQPARTRIRCQAALR
jgi:hypothetical protein